MVWIFRGVLCLPEAPEGCGEGGVWGGGCLPAGGDQLFPAAHAAVVPQWASPA